MEDHHVSITVPDKIVNTYNSSQLSLIKYSQHQNLQEVLLSYNWFINVITGSYNICYDRVSTSS